MRRSILMFVTLVLAPVAAAHAQQTVTTRDIVELTKAGLAEEVLLALIEVHRPVFPVDTETLKGLKDSGVAPNVIIAMIKSGREMPVVPPPAPTSPSGATGSGAAAPSHLRGARSTTTPRRACVTKSRVREVVVPVYYPVAVASRPIHRPDRIDHRPHRSQARGTCLLGLRRQASSRCVEAGRADIQKDARCRGTCKGSRQSQRPTSNFQLPTNFQRQLDQESGVCSWTFEVEPPSAIASSLPADLDGRW